MNDLIAGHVALNMAAIQVAKGLVETGKIKGLMVTSPERSPVLPNVPALGETGIKTAGVDLRSRDDMALSAVQAIASLSRGEWPAEKVVNPDVKARFRW